MNVVNRALDALAQFWIARPYLVIAACVLFVAAVEGGAL